MEVWDCGGHDDTDHHLANVQGQLGRHLKSQQVKVPTRSQAKSYIFKKGALDLVLLDQAYYHV